MPSAILRSPYFTFASLKVQTGNKELGHPQAQNPSAISVFGAWVGQAPQNDKPAFRRALVWRSAFGKPPEIAPASAVWQQFL